MQRAMGSIYTFSSVVFLCGISVGAVGAAETNKYCHGEEEYSNCATVPNDETSLIQSRVAVHNRKGSEEEEASDEEKASEEEKLPEEELEFSGEEAYSEKEVLTSERLLISDSYCKGGYKKLADCNRQSMNGIVLTRNDANRVAKCFVEAGKDKACNENIIMITEPSGTLCYCATAGNDCKKTGDAIGWMVYTKAAPGGGGGGAQSPPSNSFSPRDFDIQAVFETEQSLANARRQRWMANGRAAARNVILEAVKKNHQDTAYHTGALGTRPWTMAPEVKGAFDAFYNARAESRQDMIMAKIMPYVAPRLSRRMKTALSLLAKAVEVGSTVFESAGPDAGSATIQGKAQASAATAAIGAAGIVDKLAVDTDPAEVSKRIGIEVTALLSLNDFSKEFQAESGKSRGPRPIIDVMTGYLQQRLSGAFADQFVLLDALVTQMWSFVTIGVTAIESAIVAALGNFPGLGVVAGLVTAAINLIYDAIKGAANNAIDKVKKHVQAAIIGNMVNTMLSQAQQSGGNVNQQVAIITDQALGSTKAKLGRGISGMDAKIVEPDLSVTADDVASGTKAESEKFEQEDAEDAKL